LRRTPPIVHCAMDVLPQGAPAEAGAPAPLRLILRLPVIGYLRIKLLYNSPNEETPPVPGRDPRPGLHRGPSLVPRLAAGPAERPGRGPPPFSLRDISGNSISSTRFAGKPIVINFFATWCPPCRQEIPGFVEVYNKNTGNGFA